MRLPWLSIKFKWIEIKSKLDKIESTLNSEISKLKQKSVNVGTCIECKKPIIAGYDGMWRKKFIKVSTIFGSYSEYRYNRLIHHKCINKSSRDKRKSSRRHGKKLDRRKTK